MRLYLSILALRQFKGETMLLRIIDKETHLFLRDDFTFDEETEIGLDVEPSQGLNAPKWDEEKEQWIES